MIIEKLPTDLKIILGEIESLGFTLTLVGGTPRDFIFRDVLGHDLDFELRANTFIEKKSWPTYYQKLLSFLKNKNISFTELPYLITRFDLGNFKCEFSSPRLEINKEDDFSHHHFEADLDSNLDYYSSFKRRDFTINAIGIELNLKEDRDKIIDPFEGIRDLEHGLLKNISSDFFFDAVRFLRLIRFQIKFDHFVIDEKLYSRLGEFNLSKLSKHHFIEEIFKSNPGMFFNLFSKIVKDQKLEIPSEFSVWTKFTYPENLHSKEEILGFVFFQNVKYAQDVSRFFSLPEKKLRDLISFYKSYEVIYECTKDDFLKILTEVKEEGLKDPLLKELKNLEDKKEWRELLHFPKKELIISWEDWEKIKLDTNELNLLDAPLRSFLIYYKAIEVKLKK